MLNITLYYLAPFDDCSPGEIRVVGLLSAFYLHFFGRAPMVVSGMGYFLHAGVHPVTQSTM